MEVAKTAGDSKYERNKRNERFMQQNQAGLGTTSTNTVTEQDRLDSTHYWPHGSLPGLLACRWDGDIDQIEFDQSVQEAPALREISGFDESTGCTFSQKPAEACNGSKIGLLSCYCPISHSP